MHAQSNNNDELIGAMINQETNTTKVEQEDEEEGLMLPYNTWLD